MCNSVHLRGREYQTPAELAGLVGGVEKLVWHTANPFRPWPEGKDWREMDGCLCPIDLEATLQQAGFKWERGRDPFEWHIFESEIGSLPTPT
jgi:hypothetical protein